MYNSFYRRKANDVEPEIGFRQRGGAEIKWKLTRNTSRKVAVRPRV